MASFTFIELHLDDASFAADRPFSSLVSSDTDEGGAAAEGNEETVETAASGAGDDGSDVPTTPLAILGVLLVLVGIAAVVRYLSGEEPEVEIEAADEGQPVTVDE